MDILLILHQLEEELKLRGYSQKTIKTYTSVCNIFMKSFTCTDNPTQVDVRKHLLLLIEKRKARETVRLHRSALDFLFRYVCKQPFSFIDVPLPKREKPLPKVLTREEIKAMIDVLTNIKHKLLLMLAYSSGLRVSELMSLRVTDLHIAEGIIRVTKGKGAKDRITLLGKSLHTLLLHYLCSRSVQNSYLFPGRKDHITARTVQKVIDIAVARARMTKKVTPHMLRHSFATHLLEQGIDIRKIQSLLGHSQLNTTQIYTKISAEKYKTIPNPLDLL